MTQPLDLIRRALFAIGAGQSGETPNVNDVNDAFDILNEMIDQWSNDHMLVFVQQEIILELIGGQFIYTIGPGGSCGATFTGYVSGNTLTVTAQPTSGALSVGQIVSGGGTGTTAITSYNSSVGGTGTGAIGTYMVQLPQTSTITCTMTNTSASIAATNTLVAGQQIIFLMAVGTGSGGVVPGTVYFVLSTGLTSSAFEVSTSAGGTPITFNANGTVTAQPYLTLTSYQPRPLRINSAIVRVVNSVTGTLDYPVAVLAYEEYQLIGIKTLPIPWPRAMYYQPTMPLGLLQYWGNPSQGEMHMFGDTVLNQFSTINDNIILPQGYAAALRWSLAELLMPTYGKTNATQVAMVTKQAAKGRAFVKKTNRQPPMPARFDDALQVRTRQDAGWILHGGFA